MLLFISALFLSTVDQNKLTTTGFFENVNFLSWKTPLNLVRSHTEPNVNNIEIKSSSRQMHQHSSLNKMSWSRTQQDDNQYDWGERGYYKIMSDNPTLEYTSTWTHNNNGAKYSTDAKASVSYTFIGERVVVLSNKGRDKTLMDISIDGKLVATIDLNKSSDEDGVIIYSCRLQYGNHTIKLQRSSEAPEASNERIVLNCFYIQPRISKVIPIKEYIPDELGYQQQTDLPTRYRGSRPFNILFTGTQFWLLGSRSDQNGRVSITIDNGDSEIVSDNIYDGEYSSLGHHYQLLYSSETLRFGQHNITIKGVERDITLSQFIYSEHPPDATIIPIEQMSINSNWILDGEGYYTVVNHECATTFIYGTDYWLFGSTGQDRANLSIYETSVYDPYIMQPKIISTYSEEVVNHTLLHKSSSIGLNSYDLVFENTFDGDDKTSLHIYYLVYSNSAQMIPDMGCLSIPYTNLTSNIVISDSKNEIIEINYTNFAFFEYYGNKMWFEAAVGPNFGRMNVYLNNRILSKGVSLYREKNQSNVIVYESPSIPSDHYKVKIMAIDDDFPVNIHKIYYMPPPTSIFTASTGFTKSIAFSQSSSFSNSEAFSKSLSFSNSNSFEDSHIFTQSSSFSYSLFFSNSQSFFNSSSKSVHFTTLITTETDLITPSAQLQSSYLSFEESQSVMPTQPSNDGSQGSSGASIGLISGLVIGILVLIAIIILVVFLVIRKKATNSEVESVELPTTIDPISIIGSLNHDSNHFNSEIQDPFVNFMENTIE